MLGSGGMGEVFKARDTRLNRIVAIKVLRADLTGKLGSRERFESEGRAISGLNHPNICTLYDIGRHEDLDYLVMEYIEGETLANLLARGPLAIPRIVQIAEQICSALVHAHQRGLVHRDLKPGNIMVTPAGIKLLDFGLAKLLVVPPPLPEDATMSIAPETMAGTVVGTAAYMSPEQAEGKRVDTRSDIFSFGAVLYEMITGRRAFSGETAMSTLAAVLREDPASAAGARPDLPFELGQIVARCLRKDPSRRFQHMEDAGVALAEVRDGTSVSTATVTAALPTLPAISPAAVPPRSRVKTPVAVGVLALAAGVAWWIASRPSAPVELPGLTRVTSDSGLATEPTLSADGRMVAFASDRAAAGNLDIWVQQTAGTGAIRLTDDPADDRAPAISPDGSTIAFRSERDGGGIYLVSAFGGKPRLLASGGRSPRYSPQGDRIAYWAGEEQNFGSRLFVIPASGGEPKELKMDFQIARSPIWSAGGTQLMFYGSSKGFWDWYVVPASGKGQPKQTGAVGVFNPYKLDTFSAGQAPTLPSFWDSGGDVIFAGRLGDSTGLWKIAVPERSAQATGAPQRLTLGAGEDVSPWAAADGRVVFSSQLSSTRVVALPADPNAARVTAPVVHLTQDNVVEHYPHVSSDGTRLVWESNRVDSHDIWTKNLVTGETQALVSSPAVVSAPRLSRDGTRVAYSVPGSKDNADLYAVSTRGGASTRLCESCGRAVHWSKDNKLLLFDSAAPRPFGIFVLDVTTGARSLVLRRQSDIYSPRFSPDDAWIAFHAQTSPTGRTIYAAPFRGRQEVPESEWVAVTDGRQADREPYWSPDGRIVYFLSDRDGFRCIWAQTVDAGTRRPIGAASAVFHFHSARSSLTNVNWATGLVGFSLAKDKFVFALGEITGNIWMTNRLRR